MHEKTQDHKKSLGGEHQSVGAAPVVGAQVVCLAIQSEGSIGNAVCHSAHNAPKVGGIIVLHTINHMMPALCSYAFEAKNAVSLADVGLRSRVA